MPKSPISTSEIQACAGGDQPSHWFIQPGSSPTDAPLSSGLAILNRLKESLSISPLACPLQLSVASSLGQIPVPLEGLLQSAKKDQHFGLIAEEIFFIK